MYLNDPLYFLIAVYATSLGLFRSFVKATNLYENAKPFWSVIMTSYNVGMSVFSLYCCVTMARAILGYDGGVFSASLYEEPTGMVDKISYVFYVSKYVEFLDTLFLIMKSKPVGWLQYYHHIGAAFVMGEMHYAKNDGTWLFVCLNGFIHTIMYAYYAAALNKISFPLRKSTITTMQLVQFLVGLSVLYSYTYIPEFWNDEGKKFSYLLVNGYVGVLVFMFLNFYVQTYLKKKKN
jgi:hypothetical protein